MKLFNMISREIDDKVSAKKQNDIMYILRIGLTLLLIASITAASLAFVNELTKDRIEKNELAVMENALGKLFGGCDELKKIEGEFDSPVVAVYEVYKKEIVWGYGIQVAPVGFKDAIGIIVGTDMKGNCLGVEITSISDTPGVGTKVKEEGFLKGFAGLNKGNVADYATISGATVSSSAVKSGIAAALNLDIFSTFDEPVKDVGEDEFKNEEELSDKLEEEEKDE